MFYRFPFYLLWQLHLHQNHGKAIMKTCDEKSIDMMKQSRGLLFSSVDDNIISSLGPAICSLKADVYYQISSCALQSCATNL